MNAPTHIRPRRHGVNTADTAPRVIGIDVGGTFVRAAVVDADGRVAGAVRDRTPVQGGPAALVAWIARAATSLIHAHAPPPARSLVLGLALPGPVDTRLGGAVSCLNLPWIQGVPLARAIARQTGAIVHVCTDADAATWGEYAARTPRPVCFAHLRLGTGVAFGEVRRGRLVHGARRSRLVHGAPRNQLVHGAPRGPLVHGARSGRLVHGAPRGRLVHGARRGQLVHGARRNQLVHGAPRVGGHPNVLVADRGARAPRCACGLRGCLEAFLHRAAPHLEREAARGDPRIAVTPIVRGAEAAAEHPSVSRLADALSAVAANLASSLDDEAVLTLGGGVVEARPSRASEWARRMDQAAAGRHRSLRVQPARLGDDAGVIGAALLARAAHEQHCSTPPR